MIKNIKYIYTIFALLIGCIVFAQNENSLLWKISGNGLKKTSYVFGTIHMICESDYFLEPTVEKALLKADALFTEINFGNMAELMLMQESIKTDIPLRKRITKEQFEKLDFLLKNKLGIDIEIFDSVSESGISSTITMKTFLCENVKMYEIELLQKAMMNQKQLGGLETIAEQMKIMDSHLNIDATIKMLEELGTTDDSNNEMILLYKQQNIDELLNLLNESSFMNEKAFNEFVVTRNLNWINKMPELMKNKSVFFAVGAAHLGGEVGILNLLRKKGYEVEAVKDK